MTSSGRRWPCGWQERPWAERDLAVERRGFTSADGVYMDLVTHEDRTWRLEIPMLDNDGVKWILVREFKR